MAYQSWRTTDHVRSEVARRRREIALAIQFDPRVPVAELATDEDYTLILLFPCCHPAPTPPSALRHAGGLTTVRNYLVTQWLRDLATSHAADDSISFP